MAAHARTVLSGDVAHGAGRRQAGCCWAPGKAFSSGNTARNRSTAASWSPCLASDEHEPFHPRRPRARSAARPARLPGAPVPRRGASRAAAAQHGAPSCRRRRAGRTVVLGAGKAGGAMAQAVEALWPADAPLSGPGGHALRPHAAAAGRACRSASKWSRPRIPCPTPPACEAAQRILALAQGLTADDLVLCLISGGGSALLTLPAEGLTLEDKQRINRELLDSGANIGEMNCVRKHLSRIKGGRLAAACAPARVVTLTISDVPGDDPSVIASGPTVPDATSCADAVAILQRYGIEVPGAIMSLLEQGALETPKPGDAAFAGHEVHMIATPQQSLEAAAAAARAAGLCRAHPQRRDGRRIARGRQGACGAGARGGARRPAVRAALRDPVRRRDDGDGAQAARGHAARPRRPRRRVLPGAGPGAAGPGRGVGAGGGHRRHRRHGGQRRRLRRARHAAAGRGGRA